MIATLFIVQSAHAQDAETLQLAETLQRSGRGFGALVACKLAKPNDISILGAKTMTKVEPYAAKRQNMTEQQKDFLYNIQTNAANESNKLTVALIKKDPNICKKIASEALAAMRSIEKL